MQYPLSPFNTNFNTKILLEQACDVPDDNIQIQNDTYLEKLLKWLCTSPVVSSFRINTLNYQVDEVQSLICESVVKFAESLDKEAPQVIRHPLLTDVIIVHNLNANCLNLKRCECEIIVDPDCGAAILRGAHIFAPGVMGMLSGTRIDDRVSIYVDLSGKCKKGLQKKYECPFKLFIGNGIAKMNRYQLFGENLLTTGIAIQVTDTISGCPNLPNNFLPKGCAILQNLPSIVCCYVLNPKPNDVVLDMCASPGNKTTHIAAFMDNRGTLIAIDKTPSKVKQLKMNCEEFKANVRIFQADSTKILDDSQTTNEKDILNGPPFLPEVFDKILLDAPCSALGKRPQFVNNITEKVVKSYVPLQKKLFESAVHLLKIGGSLVYSTCTITLAENEAIVAWALNRFNCLELIKAEPYLGEPGLAGSNLNGVQRSYVQRFGPEQSLDSVGFFLAVFIKNNKA